MNIMCLQNALESCTCSIDFFICKINPKIVDKLEIRIQYFCIIISSLEYCIILCVVVWKMFETSNANFVHIPMGVLQKKIIPLT
jgi:hypothetical protein